MKKYAALLSLLTVLAACGGGGGRPSTDDIAKALKDKDNAVAQEFTSAFSTVDDKTIDCIAQVLEDSKVSDDALKAIVKGDKDFKGSDKDSAAIQDATTGMAKCITG